MTRSLRSPLLLAVVALSGCVGSTPFRRSSPNLTCALQIDSPTPELRRSQAMPPALWRQADADVHLPYPRWWLHGTCEALGVHAEDVADLLYGGFHPRLSPLFTSETTVATDDVEGHEGDAWKLVQRETNRPHVFARTSYSHLLRDTAASEDCSPPPHADHRLQALTDQLVFWGGMNDFLLSRWHDASGTLQQTFRPTNGSTLSVNHGCYRLRDGCDSLQDVTACATLRIDWIIGVPASSATIRPAADILVDQAVNYVGACAIAHAGGELSDLDRALLTPKNLYLRNGEKLERVASPYCTPQSDDASPLPRPSP